MMSEGKLWDSFAAMVANLKKPGQSILRSLTPEKCDAWHMASAIPSEAGELFDAIKKWVLYEKPLGRENVVEEMGDVEFYLEGLRTNLGVTRQETLDACEKNLAGRYKAGAFSNKAAQDREDKA